LFFKNRRNVKLEIESEKRGKNDKRKAFFSFGCSSL